MPPSPYTVSVDQITEPDWNDCLDQFADANIYQTWAYGAVSWGEKQLSHLVLRHDEHVVAMAQLRVVQVPLVRAGIAYLRWGPLYQRTEAVADPNLRLAVTRALIEEYVQSRRLLLRILPPWFESDPEVSTIGSEWAECGLKRDQRVRPYRTFRLHLDPPLDLLRQRLHQKWRNQLNAAERNGLEVVEGDAERLYQEFLGLYHEMMARKRFETTVDPEEFLRIQQRLPASQKLRVLIARRDGKAQTGVIASTIGKTGVYLLGATSTEGLKSKGAYLLQWCLIQHLKERGARSYDLGGINPDSNPGVHHFKEGLGGEDVLGLGRFERSPGTLTAAVVHGSEHVRSWVTALSRRHSPSRAG